MIISLLLFLVFDLNFAQDCQTIYLNEFHYDNFFRDSQVNDFVEIAGPAGTDLDGWTIMTYDHKSKHVCGNGICEQGQEFVGGDFYIDGNGQNIINCYRDCVPDAYPQKTFPAGSVIPDISNGWGVLYMDFGDIIDGSVQNDLSNGFSDGILLVNPDGELTQFVVYEGHQATGADTFNTNSPPLSTTDVGSVLTLLDNLYNLNLVPVSIQLQGEGNGCYSDFHWTGPGNTFGDSFTDYASSKGAINNNQIIWADPSVSPSYSPSVNPTVAPTVSPSSIPSTSPSVSPSKGPTEAPTNLPSVVPSLSPSVSPSVSPSDRPSVSPSTEEPSVSPTSDEPTVSPSKNPTFEEPSLSPSSEEPSVSPTTDQPTVAPTELPTTDSPSVSPSKNPTTDQPSLSPTTDSPSVSPSKNPTTDQPSLSPTSDEPSVSPTLPPTTDSPSANPSVGPSVSPTKGPTFEEPSVSPTVTPTDPPTISQPSVSPTVVPSDSPSFTQPSHSPTVVPSDLPSVKPFRRPTTSPSISSPSVSPSVSDPSVSPSSSLPSVSPTSDQPTVGPSLSPTTEEPSVSPSTEEPSVSPTTDEPTVAPTELPTTDQPSLSPTVEEPSVSPTLPPTTDSPTGSPVTSIPSVSPETSAPTANPTTDQPTAVPSNDPTTDSPTNVPSVAPSYVPSMSPTITACAESNHRVVGSDLITMTDASNWNDESDQITIAVQLPRKYTVTHIDMKRDTGSTLSLVAGEESTYWSSSFDDCMHTFVFTSSWDDIAPFAVVTDENDSAFYYTGTVQITATETFQHDIETTATYTRTIIEDLVWILGLETTVDLSVDFDVLINDASTFQVFDRLSVLQHDGSTSSVTIEYQTEVNYPWVIKADQWDFIEEENGIPYVDKGTLTELEQGAGCGVYGEYCVQTFRVEFEVTAVCDILGDWTVRHYAAYESETQEFDFSAVVSLDSTCGTTFYGAVTEATLTSYADSDLTTGQNSFNIGDTTYWRVIVSDTLQSITSIAVSGVTLEQTIFHDGEFLTDVRDGATQLSLTQLDSSDPANRQIDFSLTLEPNLVKGGEDAKVQAQIEIDYIDRRRSLFADSNGKEFLFVQDTPRRMVLYVDTDNKLKVDHVISLRNNQYCIKDESTGEKSEINDIDQQPCEGNPGKSLTRRCTEQGWEAIVDQCGDLLAQTELLTSESLNKDSSNGASWEIIFFALLAILLIGIGILCYQHLSGKPSVVSSGGPMLPKRTHIDDAAALDSIFADVMETKC